MDNDKKGTSEYMKVGEAARFLGVNRRTVYRRIWNGDLPASKVGGLYYIRRADLEAMLTPTKFAGVAKTQDEAAPQEADTTLKCGSCFRLLESDAQIADLCTQEGCESLICATCWEADERYCTNHQLDSEAKWQQVLQRHQAGELPVLVRDRNARLQEINFLNRIQARVEQMSTLIHPLSNQVLTINSNWDEYFEQGDDRAQVMRLLGRMMLDAETTTRLPLNAWLQWTIPPAKHQPDSALRIHVQVLSHQLEILRDGFDTQPFGEDELTPYLLKITQEAQESHTPVLVVLAATTGWDDTARRVILGDVPGTAFAHRQLLIYLFDLQSRELIYNPRDDRLRGYAELFAPLLPSEELKEVSTAIEKEMLNYDSLTLQHAIEILPFARQIIQQAFEKLAASREYVLTDIPELGPAIIKS